MNSKYRSMSLFLILLMLGGFLVSCYEGTVDSNIMSNESNKGLVKLNRIKCRERKQWIKKICGVLSVTISQMGKQKRNIRHIKLEAIT